jgi:hypothetical protein
MREKKIYPSSVSALQFVVPPLGGSSLCAFSPLPPSPSPLFIVPTNNLSDPEHAQYKENMEICTFVEQIAPRSLEKEDNEHKVSLKPFSGTLRVEARPGEPDQHPEASLAWCRATATAKRRP